MPPIHWTCSSCLLSLRQVSPRPSLPVSRRRRFSVAPRRPAAPEAKPSPAKEVGGKDGQSQKIKSSKPDDAAKDKAEGAMSRRLSEMTESSLESGGRSAARNVQDAEFGDILKGRLEERILTGGSYIEKAPDPALRRLDESLPRLRPSQSPPEPKPKARSGGTSSSRAQRLAAALDKSSLYNLAQASQAISDPNSPISSSERDQFRASLAERFSGPARALPNTPQGLTNLANERIEAAMAAGSFANLPRGKEARDLLGKDGREVAGGPGTVGVDMTEFVLNRLIKRQNIVPAWIEKQRELGKEVGIWRGRLRNEWKRRVVRAAGMGGGGVEGIIGRARAWAEAERVVREQDLLKDAIAHGIEAAEVATPSPAVSVQPFRDPVWLRAEASFHTASLANLNSLTRSYNLLAPMPAQRPYFSLDRELRRCYAEVAPSVVEEILTRAEDAAKRKKSLEMGLSDDEGVALEGSWSGVDRGKRYGLREFWRDLWSKEK